MSVLFRRHNIDCGDQRRFSRASRVETFADRRGFKNENGSIFVRIMDVETAQVRRAMSETYAPSRTAPLDGYFSRFTERSFQKSNISERYHENTKYTDHDAIELGESAALFTDDPSFEYIQAAMRPDYEDASRIDLPEPKPIDVPLDTVLARRRSRRTHVPKPLDRSELGTLLGRALGVTTSRSIAPDSDPFGEVKKQFRAYASGGGLYPVEWYVAVGHGTDRIPAGLYYYVPEDHALRVLSEAEDPASFPSTIDGCFATPEGVFDHTSTAVTLFMTASFGRTTAKYGPRGYRFVLQELGHAAQNLLLVAEAIDLAAVPIASFYDDRVNELLGVDGVNEAVIGTMSIGHRPPADAETPQEDEETIGATKQPEQTHN